MTTTGGVDLDNPAYYTVTMTDGCTVATATFDYSKVLEKVAYITAVNFAPDDADIFLGTNLEGEMETSYLKLGDVEAFSMDDRTSVVPVGTYNLSAYDYSFFNDIPADYGPSDLFATLGDITFELEKNYIIFMYFNTDNEFILTVSELSAATTAENFTVNVSHYASIFGPVDVINVDENTILIDDLAFGSTSDVLELPVADAYNIGLDVDQDGSIDAQLPPLAENSFFAGDMVNISAYVDENGTPMFGISMIAEGEEGQSEGFYYASLSEYMPPMMAAELEAQLPYNNGGYNNDETAGIGERSTIEIVAPEGSTSITLTLDIDTESCCDYVVIFSDMGEVERHSGTLSGVEVTVPGAYARIGVESDYFLNYDGYSITGINVQ
jgi:hypothetical protein